MDISNEQNARIVIIDDEKITRITLSKVLRKSGYEVLEAEDGESGLLLCLEQKPDLVLLDVIMPGIDGYETCRRIRKTFSYETLPIIMLTGLNDVDSVDNAFDAGATDFITKPINWSLLGQRVRYAIRARSLYEEIQKNQAKMAQAQAIAKMGYWEMSEDQVHINYSDELMNVLSITDRKDYRTSNDFLELVHPDDKDHVSNRLESAILNKKSSQFEHRITRPDGKSIFVTHQIEVNSNDSGDSSIIGIVQDITDQKEAEELILYQQLHDSLTGLPNKRSFIEKIDKLVSSNTGTGKIIGVFFVNIEKYKSISNTLGHSAADSLIQQVADELKSYIKSDFYVSRYSDDVFALIGPTMNHLDETTAAATSLLTTFNHVYKLNSEEVYNQSSIGVSVLEIDSNATDELIKGAEAAMYRARESGGNDYLFNNEKLNNQAQERLSLEREIRNGLRDKEFIVYYQPQINVKTGHVIGMEALVRWQHPQKGIIPPFHFIHVAEETGLIVALGSSVLYQACKQTKQWHDEGLGELRVGVNLSPRQFIKHDIVAEVSQILSDTQLPANLLDIEITESMAVNNLETVVEALQLFKNMGITSSMDDFGTGYSALSLMQKLPLDILKIDRSFIKDIGDGDNGAIAGAIIAMSHSLGLKVIAEGVETEAQLDFVTNYACDEIQGFYYSPPLPADEFRDFVIKHNKLNDKTIKAV